MNRKNPAHKDWAKAICSIVSQYPMLYDKRHSDYKNKMKKLEIWKGISNYVAAELQVNMTAAELEKRWLGWKCTFISEHRRLHTHPVDTNVKNWYLFNSMRFMEPYISHHRKTFTTKESFKAEYPESPEKNSGTRPTRIIGNFLDQSSQSHPFACPMEPLYLSQEAAEKSELADSTSALAISEVVGNYNDNALKVALTRTAEAHGQMAHKPVFPDSSGAATATSPVINPFVKDEKKEKCKCIIEERLEFIPIERRTVCLIEIFQVIQKYENMS
ncbi:uncharacterized protein [Fopius arisanus]|uniref:Uncharacterized protein isoform X2 n=1 Tax=Fopius arisanus TaxID=64838 RepID=A0A9R1TRI5_9HYME|nr:PREDICTED: uncharacterized protein LOC105273170 isoform X2 [Fopius arisanus]